MLSAQRAGGHASPLQTKLCLHAGADRCLACSACLICSPWRCGQGSPGCSSPSQLCSLLCADLPLGSLPREEAVGRAGLAASLWPPNEGERLSHSLQEAWFLTAGRRAG